MHQQAGRLLHHGLDEDRAIDPEVIFITLTKPVDTLAMVCALVQTVKVAAVVSASLFLLITFTVRHWEVLDTLPIGFVERIRAIVLAEVDGAVRTAVPWLANTGGVHAIAVHRAMQLLLLAQGVDVHEDKRVVAV